MIPHAVLKVIKCCYKLKILGQKIVNFEIKYSNIDNTGVKNKVYVTFCVKLSNIYGAYSVRFTASNHHIFRLIISRRPLKENLFSGKFEGS